MKKELKFALALVVVAASSAALAGYGGMANVESDGGNVSIADMLIGGALIWGVYAIWKKFF